MCWCRDSAISRHCRSVRLWKDDTAAHGGRARSAVLGNRAGRRSPREWSRCRSGGGVPAVRVVPVEDRGREHRIRTQMQESAAREARRADPGLSRAHGNVGDGGQLPPPAFGRHAAAGRHRPLLCDRAAGAADGRAFRFSRCADTDGDAGGADPDLAGQSAHGPVHYPQRGRGGIFGRSRRGARAQSRPGDGCHRHPAGARSRTLGQGRERGGDGDARVRSSTCADLAAAASGDANLSHGRGGVARMSEATSGIGARHVNPHFAALMRAMVMRGRERWRKKMPSRTLARLAAAAAALAVGAVIPAGAQQTAQIGVSYQPALYWSLPYYIASEKGWWKEAGLEPQFSTFPSGAPQMAAAGSKSWDVGGTGSAPATLGAQRFDILTIGITNDESTGNAVMARKDEAEAIRKNPEWLKGKQLLLTTNSTGEYAALACLAKWGLSGKDMQIVNLNQQEIISAFATGTGALAGVWAPNIYTLEERTGAQLICSGTDVGVTIPGTLVVRGAYAEQNPDKVTAYLAVYLRAIAWEKAHRDETIKLMKEFYQKTGVNLPDKYLAREIDTRPTFTLEGQLKLFDRSRGASDVDEWLRKLGH